MTSKTEGRARISPLRGMLGLLLLTAGCTGIGPRGARPDPAAVGKIRFGLAPDTLETLPAGRRAGMAEQVAKNLRTWGYRVEAGAATSGYSHVMEAQVGQVRRASTPAGFSFSMGNSDPRALDFQKADVLPVDCVLYPAGRPGDKASLYMDFVATDKLKSSTALADPAVISTYVDHTATVCFNLLEDLKVKRDKPAPAAAAAAAEGSTGPAWFPEVRVEVREKQVAPRAAPAAAVPAAAPGPLAAPPAPAAKPVAAPPAAPPLVAPTPIPASTGAPSAASAAPPVPAPAPAPAAGAATTAPPAPTAPGAASEPVPETPPVGTETATDPGTGRKEMIIHNQGSPIILEFGYERK